jgi:tellurite methyltransferase
MSSERDKWENRYRDRTGLPLAAPSLLLERHWLQIPAGPVLDVAAGDGRNAVFLARRGRTVHAIDLAWAGLQRIITCAREQNLPVQPIQADLTRFRLPGSYYAGVLNIRYLQRSLFESLQAALRPDGVILVETFLLEQRHLGHPTNPEHLLRRGELARRFADFERLFSEEGLLETETGPAYLSRLVARRATGGHPTAAGGK